MTELDPSLSGVLLSYAAFLLAMASPGPNVLAVIGTSMGGGRASGVALALGVAAGSLGSGVLTVLGLSALLASYAHALTVIKIAGGVFLLWLAFKAFRSAASAYDIEAAELAGGRRTPAGYALRGLTIQMTNPKAAIAWIAIVSLGLTDGAPSWVGAAIVGGCFVLSVELMRWMPPPSGISYAMTVLEEPCGGRIDDRDQHAGDRLGEKQLPGLRGRAGWGGSIQPGDVAAAAGCAAG